MWFSLLRFCSFVCGEFHQDRIAKPFGDWALPWGLLSSVFLHVSYAGKKTKKVVWRRWAEFAGNTRFYAWNVCIHCVVMVQKQERKARVYKTHTGCAGRRKWSGWGSGLGVYLTGSHNGKNGIDHDAIDGLVILGKTTKKETSKCCHLWLWWGPGLSPKQERMGARKR